MPSGTRTVCTCSMPHRYTTRWWKTIISCKLICAIKNRAWHSYSKTFIEFNDRQSRIITYLIMEPLAERMRPRTLDDYVGQEHLVGKNGLMRKIIESGKVSSFILWGPPGVGKTTLAEIVASAMKVPFYTLSAVTSGVKDVRDVIERAKKGSFSITPRLFSSSMRFTVSPSRNKTLCSVPWSAAW